MDTRLLIPLAAATLAGLALGASLSDTQKADAGAMELPSQHCAASLGEWMEETTWPAEEVLLGDQLYSRSRLWNLSHSAGNDVADLGLALATAQLNLAAGAEPSSEIIDALFEADQWFLDSQEDIRRSQQDTEKLSQLSRALNDFNSWAAGSAECSFNS
jgi:hypothetical protein